jgi:hypothetical protein
MLLVIRSNLFVYWYHLACDMVALLCAVVNLLHKSNFGLNPTIFFSTDNIFIISFKSPPLNRNRLLNKEDRHMTLKQIK